MTPLCRTFPTGAMTRTPTGRSLAFSINSTPLHVRFAGGVSHCPLARTIEASTRTADREGRRPRPVVVPCDAPELTSLFRDSRR